MGTPGAPLLQARQELRDLPRRPDVPPRAARAAHRHLSTTEFTLASYNAHWGVRLVGRRRGDAFDVAQVVRGFDADIVVVLESWRAPDGRGVLDPLADDGFHIENLHFGTFEHHVLEPERAMPGEGVWELGFCSRFPIIATRSMSIGTIGGDPASPRSVFVCTVDIGGTPVEFVALHVSSKLWKFGPVRHLRALAPQLPPPDRTAVIVGDFNLWGPGVVSILRPWRRALRGRTYPAHRPHSQIDHVLVRDDITVVSGEVLAETPSDHRPVRARLRIENRGAPGSDGSLG